MSDVKLTKQSEAILRKLMTDVEAHRLSEEELSKIREGLKLYESLGVLANVVIKAAAIVGSLAMLYQFFGGKGSNQ
jgi:hypothetical protein